VQARNKNKPSPTTEGDKPGRDTGPKKGEVCLKPANCLSGREGEKVLSDKGAGLTSRPHQRM